MLHAPVITLTTDFGTRDPYVASMKGVIRSICPHAAIDDLTHEIAPQQVMEAALFVEAAAPLFPAGTIHVVVVDPGVGTARRAVAVRAAQQTFLCPDNGVLTLFLRAHGLVCAHVVENPAVMRRELSATFHGRDLFAPAAAHLASGMLIEALGPPCGDLVELEVPCTLREADGAVRGKIIHIDRFGNCISNIVRGELAGAGEMVAALPSGVIVPARHTYGDVERGQAVALIGSGGRLEIAVRDGSAAAELQLRRGDAVRVGEV